MDEKYQTDGEVYEHARRLVEKLEELDRRMTELINELKNLMREGKSDA